jgi:hypothetical protein
VGYEVVCVGCGLWILVCDHWDFWVSDDRVVVETWEIVRSCVWCGVLY